MEVLTENDIYVNAFKKCKLNTIAMPFVRGVVIENVDAYNKIQRLLNTDKMEACHKFLYNLDVDELSEDDIKRIDNLYDLGVRRGLILDEGDDEDSDEESEDKETDSEDEKNECDIEGNMFNNDDSFGPQHFHHAVEPTPPVIQPTKPQTIHLDNAFTVMYSAMKNGEVKVGEAYSNAINTRSAKVDVLSKLEKCGYTNITILAIEAGDPDMQNCNPNEFGRDYNNMDKMIDDIEECDCIEDRDNYKPLAKTLSPIGLHASTANVKTDKSTEVSFVEDDEESENKDSESKTDKDKQTDDKDEDAVDNADEKDKDADEEQTKADDEEKELTDTEKETLKNEYTTAFKQSMKKLKLTTSVNDLSLENKIKFFTELSKIWGEKEDASKFLTDKEQEKLMKLTVK